MTEPDRFLLDELRSLLGGTPGEVVLEPLTHNVLMGMTASISRVTTDGFSAVLKVLWAGSGRELPAWQTSERPDAWNYWPREALVYEHDLPAALAGGGVVDAPRLLALR